MTSAIPKALTLSPPGTREVVDESIAKNMVKQWQEQLIAHRSKCTPDVTLCQKLILTDKSYTSEAASIISSFLTSTDVFSPSLASQITNVDMSDIIASRMEEEGLQVLQTISDAFAQSKLKQLDLSDNAMGSKGITACRTVLEGQASSLEELSLCNNGLSEASMCEVADILTSSSDSASGAIAERLVKLHFFNNMSGNGGCVAFERIMKHCTDALVDLRFSSTRAGSEGSSHIVQALSSLAEGGCLKNVKRLDLADNSFGGGDVAKVLAKALEQCHSLEYLNLKDCLLGDDGVVSICASLQSSNAAIVHLDLSANEITRVGAKAVAGLLKTHLRDSLRVLHMEENEMTSLGVKYIAVAMQSPTLEDVKLGCNECGNIGAFAVAKSAKTLPALKSIHLDGNMFSEEAVDALSSAFGDKLLEMEDNEEDEDVDEDLSDVEDEDEDIDGLTSELSKLGVEK